MSRSRRWRLGPGAFRARPRLLTAMAIGLAGGVASRLAFPGLQAASSAIAGWDIFCAIYLGLTAHAIRGRTPAQIRAQAERQDQGQAVILLMILAACVVSVAVVAFELSSALHEHGSAKALRVVTAFVTVSASWLTLQTVFALHYAHEYYARDTETGHDQGGLAFPGGEPPDDWDFLHFAVVIGVAAQTADIAFTSRTMRRLGTIHSLIAFAFNTLVLALTVNLLAGLV